MQNQWRVIDCTDLDGSISYERGRMRVVKNDTGECVDVPLAQIAVVLLGLHVRCSAAVLHEMARYGVSVMLCDWRGVPDAALHAWTDMPTTVTTRQLAQSNMSLPRKKSAWARIVHEDSWTSCLPRFIKTRRWRLATRYCSLCSFG